MKMTFNTQARAAANSGSENGFSDFALVVPTWSLCFGSV